MSGVEYVASRDLQTVASLLIFNFLILFKFCLPSYCNLLSNLTSFEFLRFHLDAEFVFCFFFYNTYRKDIQVCLFETSGQ